MAEVFPGLTATHLRDRLESRGIPSNIRLFAQGYMERVICWVRPAEHFTELRAGWDRADVDLRAADVVRARADINTIRNTLATECQDQCDCEWEEAVASADSYIAALLKAGFHIVARSPTQTPTDKETP
jgi:hypothetical protein